MKKKEKLSIKKSDLVKVITGDQKGLIGRILSINHKKSQAILENGKVREKKIKNSQETNDKGEKQKKLIPISIHTSNLMLWDAELKQASRIGFKMLASNDQKQRYFKKSGNIVLEITNTRLSKDNKDNKENE